MLNRAHWSIAGATVVVLGLSAGAFVPLLTLQPTAIAAPEEAPYFSDIGGSWAQPFIQKLAAQNLVEGYPDGTFRPDQPVRRDEFAAMLGQAFSQPKETSISDGNVYNDVPADHWAKDAIEEAHESGFMSGYPGGLFAPDRDISRTEVLVSLAQNLNLDAPPTTNASAPDLAEENVTAASSTPEQSPTAAAPTNTPTANQPASSPQQAVIRTFLMPMAMTTLMQPLVTPSRAASPSVEARRPAPEPEPETTAAPTTQPNPTASTTDNSQSFDKLPSEVVSNYYADAQKIPLYAVDAIAAATQANMVVNYPDPQVLNPDQPATRAEVTALIHQALVQQGRQQPLTESPAADYVVE